MTDLVYHFDDTGWYNDRFSWEVREIYDLFYYFEWSKKLLYDYQNKIIYKKIPDIIRDLRLTPPSQQYW